MRMISIFSVFQLSNVFFLIYWNLDRLFLKWFLKFVDRLRSPFYYYQNMNNEPHFEIVIVNFNGGKIASQFVSYVFFAVEIYARCSCPIFPHSGKVNEKKFGIWSQATRCSEN